METIEERAREFADNHEQAELELRGLGHVYGYSRIYNSEKVAYERGSTEQKAIDDAMWLRKTYKWIKENVECGIHPQSAYGFADRFLKAMKE